MDQKTLKTSLSQRIIIIVIAILLLGSTIFAYLFIVLNNGSSSSQNTDQIVADLTEKYDAKQAEINAASEPLSDQYFDTFKGYLKDAKAYNAASANAGGLKSEDLEVGTGKTLTEGDTNYLAYYIGWCADGEVFQTSFDNDDEPTKLKAPIDPSMGLIEGWNQGVIGMKIGGVRLMTIPSELAYGDDESAVCGANAPLKFIIMAIEDETVQKLSGELNDIYYDLLGAYYDQYGTGVE